MEIVGSSKLGLARMLSLLVIVMGVAGSGKTALGMALSEMMSAEFWDADEFHSDHCKRKMGKGFRLNEDDRYQWIDRIVERASQKSGGNVVLACSALRRHTRVQLSAASKLQNIIWLKGTYDEVHARVEGRVGHYFPATLLKSQFEDLEEPPDALVLQCYQPISTLVSIVAEHIDQLPHEKNV